LLAPQALVILGGLAGLSGASLMKHLERTAAWQVWPLLSPPTSKPQAARRLAQTRPAA
jgi:hypothetical protein